MRGQDGYLLEPRRGAACRDDTTALPALSSAVEVSEPAHAHTSPRLKPKPDFTREKSRKYLSGRLEVGTWIRACCCRADTHELWVSAQTWSRPRTVPHETPSRRLGESGWFPWGRYRW